MWASDMSRFGADPADKTPDPVPNTLSNTVSIKFPHYPPFDISLRFANFKSPGRRRDPAQRLVVAACGPAELVEAARNAVGCVRKEGCRVRLYFSGTDSRW